MQLQQSFILHYTSDSTIVVTYPGHIFSRLVHTLGRSITAFSFKSLLWALYIHDDVIKWKHFPCYWPFVRGIHRSPVNFPHKGQWRGALMFSLICVWINDWVNNRETGDLRRQSGHYDVIVMKCRTRALCHLGGCRCAGDKKHQAGRSNQAD